MPTAKEQGLDVEVAQYRFMTVPKGTPQDVKDTIIEGMQATFETEEYQAFNEANSLTPMEISGEEVAGPAGGRPGALRLPRRGVRHQPGGMTPVEAAEPAPRR